MTTPFFGSIPWQTLRRRVCTLAVCAALAPLAFAALAPLAFAAEAAKRFDLAADAAERALKQFSQQSGLEVVFASELTDGVRANAVRGEFTPLEAARRLLEGTPLSVVRDDKTGVLSVRRTAAPAPAPAPAKNADSRLPAVATAAAAGATPTAADGAVMLSEFRVDTSRDRGYVATNSTTGTRLNLPIKQMPMPIEVITREFIDDIGAVDVKEALEYSAGVVQDTVTAGNNFMFSPSGSGQAGSLTRDNTAINIRGFNSRSFLRSGFRQDTVTDVVNIDRQEVARGPQSLLYGVASLGGIVALTPKYPRSTRKTDLRVGFGSNDFYRAELYRTGPILRSATDNRYLNYGVGFVYQNQSSRSDFDDRNRLLVTPAIEFRPFRNTTVFIDLEYGKFKLEGNGFADLIDSNAGNVRNPVTGQLIAESLNEFGETRTVARDLFGRDRFFRWSGGDTYAKDDYFNGTIEITQKLLPGLTMVLGGNYNDRLTEIRSVSGSILRTTTASPAVRPTALGVWTAVGADPVNPAVTQWKTVGYGWGRTDRHKYIKQARIDLTYEFSLWGNKQNILLGRTDQGVRQSELSTAQVTSNTPGGTNRSFVAFGAPSYLSYQGEQHRPFRDTVFSEWDTGHYAIYQGKWWKDRITLIGGARAERYMVRQYFSTFTKANAALPDSDIGNWVKPASPDPGSLTSAPGALPVVNGYRFGGEEQRDESLTFGVNVAVNRDINLYAVSAGGIFPNTGQRDGAANAFKPERSQSEELGVKLDLWKDRNDRARISATVSWFRIDRENAVYNVFWAPQPRSNNQATLRAGMTRNVPVSGTGPNAYAVTNSAYRTFQTNQPVTYLLPATYVAPADANHPRVTGAPQQSGFILVDYASLGSAATDPLRRAMEAAAADPANLTALQAGNVGSGSTGLYANNAYLNRNSDVPYDDRSHGVDAQIYLNFTDNWSTVLTYTHLVQEITGGFQVVDQPASTEYDSWWRFMGATTDQARANLDESSYDIVGGVKGRRTTDNPRNQWAVWNKYSFTTGRLRGLDASVGVTINGSRQSEVVIDNGIRDRSNDLNRRYRPRVPSDYKLNLAFGYRGTFFDRRWNIRLNINNVLDEQKVMGTNTTDLYINRNTGALIASASDPLAVKTTVTNRAVRYFEPRSFRLTASTSF